MKSSFRNIPNPSERNSFDPTSSEVCWRLIIVVARDSYQPKLQDATLEASCDYPHTAYLNQATNFEARDYTANDKSATFQ